MTYNYSPDPYYCFTYGAKGYAFNITASGSLHEYDPVLNTWTALTSVPVAKSLFYFILVGSKVYVFGGYVSGTSTPQTGCHVFDLVAKTWTALANLPVASYNPNSSEYHSNYVSYHDDNNKIYFLSWFGTLGSMYHNLYEYDIASNTWSTKAAMPKSGSVYIDSNTHFVAYKGKCYRFFGSANNNASADTTYSVYDIATNTWTVNWQNVISGGSTLYVEAGQGIRVGNKFVIVGSKTQDSYTTDSNGYTSANFIISVDLDTLNFTKSTGSAPRSAWNSLGQIYSDGRYVYCSVYDTIWSPNGGGISKFDTVTNSHENLFATAANAPAEIIRFLITDKLYATKGSGWESIAIGAYVPVAYLKSGSKVLSSVRLFDSNYQAIVANNVETTINTSGYAYALLGKGTVGISVLIH
jgi:hypothetical protein